MPRGWVDGTHGEALESSGSGWEEIGSCGQEPLSWFLWEGMGEAGWAGVNWLVRIISVGSGGIQALPGGLVSGPIVFRSGGEWPRCEGPIKETVGVWALD